MSTMPATIRVGPYTYKIVFDEAAINKESNDSKLNLVGRTIPDHTVIMIRPDMAKAVEASTLLHEVLHAIGDYTGISRRLGSDTEEELVDMLAPALLDTLRRNPQLILYLLNHGDD